MSFVEVLLNEPLTSGFQVVKDYPTTFGGLTVKKLFDKPKCKDRFALSKFAAE